MIKDSLYGPHSAVLTAFNFSSQFQRSPGGRALISCGYFILYILSRPLYALQVAAVQNTFFGDAAKMVFIQLVQHQAMGLVKSKDKFSLLYEFGAI